MEVVSVNEYIWNAVITNPSQVPQPTCYWKTFKSVQERPDQMKSYITCLLLKK